MKLFQSLFSVLEQSTTITSPSKLSWATNKGRKLFLQNRRYLNRCQTKPKEKQNFKQTWWKDCRKQTSRRSSELEKLPRKSRLKCYSQVPSRLKAKQRQLGFPGALNHPFKPKETEQLTTHRNSNTGYAWNVKPRAEWTERCFPSLITENAVTLCITCKTAGWMVQTEIYFLSWHAPLYVLLAIKKKKVLVSHYLIFWLHFEVHSGHFSMTETNSNPQE